MKLEDITDIITVTDQCPIPCGNLAGKCVEVADVIVKVGRPFIDNLFDALSPKYRRRRDGHRCNYGIGRSVNRLLKS